MPADTAKAIPEDGSEDGIDVSKIELAQLSTKAFPVRQPFRIFISEQAHQDIWQHARSTIITDAEIKEVGGVLVGEIYKDDQGPFLDVKAAIIAEHTRNEGTEVAFTPETWAQVNGVKDKRYPDDRIVGWYHTHPRFGIFLSERDQFIQRHSFSQPWATAFVVDPVQKTEGFFYWSGDEPKEADEYWVGQERHQPKPKEDAPSTGDEDSDKKAETKATLSQLSAAISTAVGLLALLFAIGYVYWQGWKQYERDKVLMRGLASQTAELDRSIQTLSLLRRVMMQPQPAASTPTPTPSPTPSQKKTAEPAPTPQVAPPRPQLDPQVQGLLQDMDHGLKSIGTYIAVLMTQIAGQEVKLETVPANRNSTAPSGATPAPPNSEANKP